MATLLNRNLTGYWRNPTYLLSKFILTSGAGIVIGLSFLHTKDNLQGTQNQLWVRVSIRAKSVLLLKG